MYLISFNINVKDDKIFLGHNYVNFQLFFSNMRLLKELHLKKECKVALKAEGLVANDSLW